MLGVDPRRFGPYAQQGYLIEKNEEAYAKVFTVHYPNEERAAARPLRQTPCYDRMKALGAVFGSVYGWERPNFFAPPDYELSEAELDKPDVLLNENHPAGVDGERRARNGVSAAPTISTSSAPNAATCTRTSACRTCRPSPSSRCRGRAPRPGSDSILTNKIPKALNRVTLTYLLTKTRRRARRVHADPHRAASASISSPPARWRRTTTTRC